MKISANPFYYLTDRIIETAYQNKIISPYTSGKKKKNFKNKIQSRNPF